jgi:RluA family pseudouridine synthase
VPIQKLRFLAARDHATKRLDDALAGWLPEALARPVSRAKVRKLIMAGAVRWNGKPVRIASKTLQPGAVIEVYVDLAKLFADSTSRDKPFELAPDRILFEDEDLIVIDKPPGIPLHPTADAARDNLFAAVQRFLSRRDGSAKPYLGIHQRLDRDTSGVVLFTKSERVNAAVGRMFSEHQAVKIYQALTVPRSNSRSTEWTVRNYLGKVASKSRRAKYGSVKGGDLAETFFRVIRENPRGVWLEAIPKTGRTHQIRVHLAEHGLPILGDDLYGADSGSAPRLMLHASELIFQHPVTGFKVSIKSPLPRDFDECLKRMHGGK